MPPATDDPPDRRRPGGPRRVAGLVLPPLSLMAVIWALSAQPDLSSGLRQDFALRKAAHVTEFAVLTALWTRALAGLGDRSLRRAAPWAAAVIALAWAAVDERHQHFVEGRVGSVRDVGIDAIGVALALIVLRWRARRTAAPARSS